MQYLYIDTTTVVIFIPSHYWLASALQDKLFTQNNRNNLQLLVQKSKFTASVLLGRTKGKRVVILGIKNIQRDAEPACLPTPVQKDNEQLKGCTSYSQMGTDAQPTGQ